jgi:hypothetical protein
MNCTRLNITYSIKKLNKIVKYLRCILYFELYYIAYPVVLKMYNNLNWISDTKNSKSTSGYVFTHAGAIMS